MSREAGEKPVVVDTGIRIVYQSCSNWCWAADIEMLSGKYGQPTTQCGVVAARFQDPSCCAAAACYGGCNQGANSPETVTTTLQAHGIQSIYEPSYLSSAQLRAWLDAGSPVLAATVPHAFIVSGYRKIDGQYSYLVLDPFPLVGAHWVSYTELRNYGGYEWAFSWYAFE